MDQYPIEAAGSTIENNPMYRVFFKSPIDPIRLEEAFRKAIIKYPLFGTKVEFDKEYYLIDNEAPLKIIKSEEKDRPKTFGKNTNNYPWMCCYSENKLTFEWLHGVSDGTGALNFIKTVLIYYFNAEESIQNVKTLVASGLEPFFDKNEKGINFINEKEGFSFKQFPVYKRGYESDCYCLKADTKEILSLAHNTYSSVAPVISVLFSKAIRMHLPENMKNRDVACNIVLDLRRPLNYETMHNCVEYKRITLTDERDNKSLTSVFQEYKDILDKARLKENVVKIITDRVKMFKAYHFLPFKKWLKFCVKLVGLLIKDSDCNFVFTYPGKIDLPEKVMDRVENIDFKVWHDFGECILAAVDYNGSFNMNICINFVEKGVIEDFIKLCDGVGIHWQIVEKGLHVQAHYEE